MATEIVRAGSDFFHTNGSGPHWQFNDVMIARAEIPFVEHSSHRRACRPIATADPAFVFLLSWTQLTIATQWLKNLYYTYLQHVG